jgi:hypothetical protein
MNTEFGFQGGGSGGGGGGGITQAYQTIQDEGTPLTQQSVLNLIGNYVSASNGTGKTNVTIGIINEFDATQAPTYYSGVAPFGTSTSTIIWALTKTVVAADGSVTIYIATDSWDNRLTASYSPA